MHKLLLVLMSIFLLVGCDVFGKHIDDADLNSLFLIIMVAVFAFEVRGFLSQINSYLFDIKINVEEINRRLDAIQKKIDE